MRHAALTIRGNGILRSIITEVSVCLPHPLGKAYTPADLEGKIKTFKGVWDTGATGSVITQSVVDSLSLKPTGKKKVNTASGVMDTDTYLVDFLMEASGLFIQGVEVTRGILAGIDILIGMDVITLGDFSITNKDGKTVMSFSVPSTREHDYVPSGLHNNTMHIMKEKSLKVGKGHNNKKKKKRKKR